MKTTPHLCCFQWPVMVFNQMSCSLFIHIPETNKLHAPWNRDTFSISVKLSPPMTVEGKNNSTNSLSFWCTVGLLEYSYFHCLWLSAFLTWSLRSTMRPISLVAQSSLWPVCLSAPAWRRRSGLRCPLSAGKLQRWTGQCWSGPCRAVNGLNEWRSLFHWCESACRHDTCYRLTGSLNDWFTDWTYTLTDCLLVTELALWGDWKHWNIVVFSVHHHLVLSEENIGVVYFPIEPEYWNTPREHGACGVWKEDKEDSFHPHSNQTAGDSHTPNLKKKKRQRKTKWAWKHLFLHQYWVMH